MKKHISFTLLIICLLAACTYDENDFGQPEATGTHTFFATIEQESKAATRMTVKDDNSVHWEQTDQVGIYGTATTNALFACKQLTENGATFTGDMDKAGDEITLAYYPYQKETTLNGNTLRFELPSEYSYKGNSNAPMLGVKGNDKNFTFKHTCGLIRITLGSLPADAERFVISSIGEDAPAIAGKAMIEDVKTTNATLRIESGGSRTITFHLENLATGTELRHFFVPLPIGSYGKLEVSLYGKGKETPYFTRATSNVAIKRATILNMPIINGDTGKNYVLSSNTIEITENTASQIKLSTDGSTLTYSKDAVATDIPKVGQNIISRPQANLPSGFLGKVTEVKQNSDGSWTINTEHIHIFEAFESLYVNETIELAPENSDNPASRSPHISIDSTYTDQINHFFYTGVSHRNEEGSIRAHGSIRIGANLGIEVAIDKSKGTSDIELGMTVASNTDIEYKLNTLSVPLNEYGKKTASLRIALPAWEKSTILLADGLLPLHITPAPFYSCSTNDDLKGNINLDEENAFFRTAWSNGNVWETPREDVYAKGADNLDNSVWQIEELERENVFKGTLSISTGINATVNMYNRDSIYASFSPTITNTLSGEVTLEKDRLKEGGFASTTTSSGVIKGKESFFLISKDGIKEVKQQLASRTETDSLKVIPVKFPLKHQTRQATTKTRAGEENYITTVSAETQKGILDMEKYKFNLVLLDNKDAEFAVSPDFSYNEEEQCNISHTFEGLLSDSKYKAYLKVTHPLLKDFAEGDFDNSGNGSIGMIKDSITIDTHDKIREVLMKIYKENGGKNWEHQKNWCTDAPVSEWQGVTLLDDGTYRFDFMNDYGNKITGKFSLINCDIPILFPSTGIHYHYGERVLCCAVEELHLENCTNLQFEDCITSTFPILKSAYIDNINIEDKLISSNGNDYELHHVLLFYRSELEKIEIKNCKGIINRIQIDTENLKVLKIDNIKFTDLDDSLTDRYGSGVIHINVGTLCSMMFEEIVFNNLSNVGINIWNFSADKVALYTTERERDSGRNESDRTDIRLKNCNINDVLIENLDRNVLVDLYLEQDINIGNLKIENCFTTRLDGHSADGGYSRKISAIDITGRYLVFPNENNEMEVSTLKLNSLIEPGYGGDVIYMKHFKGLKVVEISGGSRCDLSFKGCTELQSIILHHSSIGYDNSATGTLDIRETPSLTYFYSYSNLKKLLFDENFNRVDATCYSKDLLQEFPGFFNGANFKHDQRYEYIYEDVHDEYGSYVCTVLKEVIDRGYGWWYPGEPGKGKHEP